MRFVVDPDETERVEQVFKEYFVPLKSIFIELAAESNFPKVGRESFEKLLHQCELVDKKHPVNYFAMHFDAALYSDEKGKKGSANCSRA